MVTDNFSMINVKDLYHMDIRFQKMMMKLDLHFGGVYVILVRDPSQLPPVRGNSLLDPDIFSDAETQVK